MPHDRFFPNEYYTEDKNERQSYDLVLPENASGDLGLVLCIHGGGWVEGKKDTYTDHLFKDDIVPYRNALDLRDRLTEKKVPHSFVSFPDSNHECENKSSSAAVMKLFFEYIDAYLDPKYPG